MSSTAKKTFFGSDVGKGTIEGRTYGVGVHDLGGTDGEEKGVTMAERELAPVLACIVDTLH